jgi:fumarate reductase flavoprotein subunit
LAQKAETAWGQYAKLKGNGTENPYEMRAELGYAMDQHFGIRLTNADLAKAAATIQELATRYQNVRVADTAAKYNTDFQQAVELGYLLDCAAATVAAAEARQESRGAFQNLDYPEPQPQPKHSLVTRPLKVTTQAVSGE